jgi:hypothetical protein
MQTATLPKFDTGEKSPYPTVANVLKNKSHIKEKEKKKK